MYKMCLKDKFVDKDYFNSLCDRRQKELEFCQAVLEDEDLISISSIQVGYKKARLIFIDEYLVKINPELAEKAREDSIPVFNKLEIVNQVKSELENILEKR